MFPLIADTIFGAVCNKTYQSIKEK